MTIVFDLDDTLYDEIDFVKSGFKEISNYLVNDSYYDFMLDDFIEHGSGKVFNNLIDKFNLNISIQKLVEIYRFHKPNIHLPKESLELLEYSSNYTTALISDGFYLMQQNKYKTLGLDKYIDYPVFTDFYHTKKPELKAFEMVMQKFKNEKDFIYISDNPKKDFIAPNSLGWKSIRYKNPIGIYNNYVSDATYEVENRKDIIKFLRKQ
ncbi:MAG: HAD family hydrolase [Campylobacterota bacterium]|nr:HAD family hydrolase [Campylobacterota bacterium]